MDLGSHCLGDEMRFSSLIKKFSKLKKKTNTDFSGTFSLAMISSFVLENERYGFVKQSHPVNIYLMFIILCLSV